MYTLDDVRRYREAKGKKKLILDTNLLLLLFVGTCDINFLPICNSTSKYTKNHYEILLKIFRFFDAEIVVTPHIIAELSNIAIRDIKEPKIHYFLRLVVDKLRNYKEEHVALGQLLGIKINLLARYGFPDLSIIETAKKIDAIILTDDISLALYSDSFNVRSIKFGAVTADYILKT